MIATKGSSTLPLRRSKNSLSALSQFTGSSDLSQTKLKRSSSSLYVKNLSIDSTSPSSSFYSRSSFLSQDSKENFDRDSTVGQGGPPKGGETNVALCQAVLLLVAIPCYKCLNDIVQFLDVDFRNVPFLLAFGILPTFYLKLQKRNCSCTSLEVALEDNKPLVDSSASSSHSLSSLAKIELFYQNHADTTFCSAATDAHFVDHKRVLGEQKDVVDEWGHFADFEEIFHEESLSLLKDSTQSTRSNLQTLQETDEEYDHM